MTQYRVTANDIATFSNKKELPKSCFEKFEALKSEKRNINEIDEENAYNPKEFKGSAVITQKKLDEDYLQRVAELGSNGMSIRDIDPMHMFTDKDMKGASINNHKVKSQTRQAPTQPSAQDSLREPQFHKSNRHSHRRLILDNNE